MPYCHIPQLTWCSAKDMVLTSMFQGLVRLFGSWQWILCEVCTMDFHWHCAESLPYCESSFGRRRMLRVAKDKDLLRVSRCCDISKMWLCKHCSFWGLKKKERKRKHAAQNVPRTSIAVIVNGWYFNFGWAFLLTSCVFVYCAHLLHMIFNAMCDCLHARQPFFFLHTPWTLLHWLLWCVSPGPR